MNYNELINLYYNYDGEIKHVFDKSFENNNSLVELFDNLSGIDEQGYIKNTEKELMAVRIKDERIRIVSATEISKDIYFTKYLKIFKYSNYGLQIESMYNLVKSGKIISNACFSNGFGDLWLQSVETIEEERRKGYSTLLIDLAFKDIKQVLKDYNKYNHYRSFYLHVAGEKDPETNFRYKFYEKFGFKITYIPYMEIELKNQL